MYFLFQFQVSAVDAKSPTIYDFRIIFVELRLDSVHNEEINLDGVQDGTIRATHLHYDTVPQSSAGEDIVYHIMRGTKYGSLILGDGTASGTESKLRSGDSFTQNDITNGKLRYSLNRRAYSRIHDDFTFKISTKAVNNGEPSNEISTFTLIHVPGPTSDPVRSTNEKLEVVEGGQQIISSNHLHLETSRVAAVSYNITRGPRHGRIDVLKTGTAIARANATWFDSREIASEKVVYVHDDSESKRDSFHFLAYAPDFQYLGVFHFDIILKNDNKPMRTIDRVFRVVKGGEKLLTGNDLKYEDADIDTKPEDIVYTRRGIPNGGIYNAKESNTPLFEFTQADLNAGRVLFKHDGGDEYGKVVLLVSDGDSYANGVLEVRASPPFVELVNNSGLIVQRSVAVPLTPANLSAETNVNARPQDMKYEILEAPAYGRLELDGEKAKVFSEYDIEQGGVVYRHDGGNSLKDHFRFRVDAAGSAKAEGRFELRIFPAAYWESLIISSNRTLHVEESTSVQIGPTILKVRIYFI
jgi:chondroitin sulfate proteoglycan 4